MNKTGPKTPVRRLATVRAETLEVGDPTIGEGHPDLIDALADKAAADAVDRVLAKKRKVRPRRPR